MGATETPHPTTASDFPSTLADWLRLEQTPGVGMVTAASLIEHFHTPAAIFAAAEADLLAKLTLPTAKAQAAALRRPDVALLAAVQAQCEQVLAWLARPGRRLLTLTDPGYPAILLQLCNPPLLLYVVGRADLLAGPALAIVGSRNGSAQGMANAARFGQSLSEAGLTIVSGLALGIDAAAHEGGLRGPGSTIAVVGTGADRIYPARNRALAERIAEQGCIISEYPLGTPPAAANFPRRNRVISGLARGVLVVEAALKSGTLTTARLALDQNRDVYAIPGSIHSALSKGCHALLRKGAKLVECADDILEDVHAGKRAALHAEPDTRFVDALLAALGGDPAGVDTLALRLTLAPAEVQCQLLALELAGLIERLPGGTFQRI